jgi:ribosomal protein S6--L-glutamate ligase
MRLALLGDPHGWHLQQLVRAAVGRGHEPSIVAWPTVTASLGGTAGEHHGPPELAAADTVIVRTMPAGSLEEVILRMDILGRIAATGTRVINHPRSLEVAIDKYLSLARISAAGLPVPRTVVVQRPDDLQAAWEMLGGDAVSKPLFGSRGRGIERLDSAAAVGTAAATLAEGRIGYLQEFVPHDGWDVRILLVGDRVFAMRRIATGDWRMNLARGARPEPFAPPTEWVQLARGAAAAVGTEVAGVDLLPTHAGGVVVLEVNGVPGWRGLQTVCGDDIATAVIDLAVQPT